MSSFTIRRSLERGYFDHGWLKSFHSFSFAEYFDSKHMNFRALRVINEDVIQPKTGFDFHPHQSMEIITYVLRGSLTHRDNLGNKEEIKAGEFQVMSAGSGIVHSEFNYGQEEVHLLQIWIKPNLSGGAPSYKISSFNHFEKWSLVASSEGENDSFAIKQDAKIYALNSGFLQEISLPNFDHEYVWIQLAEGEIVFNQEKIFAGDGVSFATKDLQKNSKIFFTKPSKLILFALR